jgi:very-short-patch-repair endonuclease
MNGLCNPRNTFKKSNKKFWFTCSECSSNFNIILSCVSGNGSWCPKCKKKTENKLHSALDGMYSLVVYQYKQDWCMNKKHLPFDFCIPEKKVIIELDGPQHFTQVSNWKSPERCLENDIFKQRCANENGYSVVRIIQDDVWFDRYDWFTKLQEALKNIGDCENVFLCQNHEYDTLQSALIQSC